MVASWQSVASPPVCSAALRPQHAFLPPPTAAQCLRSHLSELLAASWVSPLIGYLLTLPRAARHIRLIRHHFAIMNFSFLF